MSRKSLNRRLALLAGACVALTATSACSKPGPAGARNAAGQSAASQAAFTAPRAPEIRWVTFTDPVEHAFTIDVPQGWSVQGGVRRMAAVDIRPGVVARSPDGAIELYFGDPDVPAFVVPNAGLEMVGLREGANYSPGYGVNMTISRYVSGDAFARDWGLRRISATCGGAAPTGVRAAPHVSSAIAQTFAQYGIHMDVQAGEAEFACQRQDGPGAGYATAATQLVQSGPTGIWTAAVLAGFSSRADRKGQAGELLSHMLASYRIDPDWAARQQGITADVTRITTATNNAVSQSIHDRYANKQAADDRIFARDAQARRGTATFVDPVEGERELANAEHQWRTRDGRTVATTTSQPPEPGAVELQRAPR